MVSLFLGWKNFPAVPRAPNKSAYLAEAEPGLEDGSSFTGGQRIGSLRGRMHAPKPAVSRRLFVRYPRSPTPHPVQAGLGCWAFQLHIQYECVPLVRQPPRESPDWDLVLETPAARRTWSGHIAIK